MSPPPPGRQRLFLLSHMRAHTSLVGHILGSHPEIDGYYELHRAYRTAADLAAAWAQYAAHDAPKPGGRYLFDKLLHNDYALDPDLPELADAVFLLALRPPGPTLRSIVALFARKSGADPYATPAGAAGYYLERLAALAAFAARHPGRYRYFDAPLARDDPPRLLAALAGWLGLSSPLSERYRMFSRTGLAGAGDSSPALAEGRILGTTPPPPEIELDPDLARRVEAVWRNCRARLIAQAGDALLM